MADVNILLNGEDHEVPDDLRLEQLLDFFSLSKQRVAVEMNGSVIRRVDWHGTLINDGDRIEVVHFVGGG